MKPSCLQAFSLLALLPAAMTFALQAPSLTTLTSSSPSLQLPGSIKITAMVAPQTVPEGMPSGTVQFFNNSKQPLGSGPLQTIPATQKFALPALPYDLGNNPFGVFSFASGISKYSVLGMLDIDPTEAAAPRLSIYSGEGERLFLSPVKYVMSNSGLAGSSVDAHAVADFTHDGIPDVLIHGFNFATGANEYYVLPGQAGAIFNLAGAVISPDNGGVTCTYTYCTPTESISIDDFNGDGYNDVAYTGTGGGANGQVGVAINAGASAAGMFTTYVKAPAIATTVTGETFTSTGIATGHFTSSGFPDIAVTGSNSVDTTGYVALYLNNGAAKGTFSFANPVLFTVGSQPGSIATADFRANGLTDVVVGTVVSGKRSGTIQVLIGDGKGHLTPSSSVAVAEELASISVGDMNNDGFPDIVAVGIQGALYLLLNDGTGQFKSALSINGASAASIGAIGDFNGDGLADLAELTKFSLSPSTALSTASVFLNSAASQATFTTAAHSLAAGSDIITAEFAGDNNFAPSVSEALPIDVTRTTPTLTWSTPAAIEYGIPLGTTQFDAQSSVAGVISYSLATGTILKPGSSKVTATFVPTDTFDYSGTTATQTVTVLTPTLAGISPSSGKLGDANTTITIKGQGLVKGAVAMWNKTALSTTWVSLNELTAIVPGSFLAKTGTGSVTVVDPNGVAVAGALAFTITAPLATASAYAPTTAEAGQGGSLTLTVNPYPAPVAATLTLQFAPDPPITIEDPNVLFPNNSTTETIQIPANSTAAIPAIDFSTGSTAGTITLTIKLVASGVDITPASLAPLAIAVPATAPVINSVTLERSGDTLTVSITGLSSTRDMSQAAFHFTAASGASLKTIDVPVELGTAFTAWYSSAPSDAFGTTFLYTQPFTLSSDAKSVGSVSVILTNSKGASQPGTAQ